MTREDNNIPYNLNNRRRQGNTATDNPAYSDSIFTKLLITHMLICLDLKLMSLHLFTELFRSDFCPLPATNCSETYSEERGLLPVRKLCKYMQVALPSATYAVWQFPFG